MRQVSKDMNDEHRYDDMVHMNKPVSKNHRLMPMLDRAAQFAPFAALTGYNESIEHAQIKSVDKIELSDTQMEELNQQILSLAKQINEHPMVAIRYYTVRQEKEYEKITTGKKNRATIKKDEVNRKRARGEQKLIGFYQTKRARLKSIDVIHQEFVFMDHHTIPFNDILTIHYENKKTI